jgi:hypothetical protein
VLQSFGGRVNIVVLGPTHDSDFCSRERRAFSSVVVPGPTPRAVVDQLEVVIGNSGRDLSSSRVSRVYFRSDVATWESQLRNSNV